MSIIERLQPHTVQIYKLTEDSCIEKVVDARLLLTPSRFDLFAKLYYIRNKDNDKENALLVYNNHIKAFNPDLREPGREDKKSYFDFLSAFDIIIETFKDAEFDNKLSLVPITEDNIILDGSHRVAALAYWGKKVCVVLCKGIKQKCDFNYLYFKNRGLSWSTMDKIALEMLEWIPNMHVACLWPAMRDKSIAVDYIKSKFEIAYEKKISVNLKSLEFFIAYIYKSQTWVTHKEYILDKAINCYGRGGYILFLFFTSSIQAEVLQVKDNIRSIYKIEKHSIHVTDNCAETKDIGRYILDQDALESWNSRSGFSSIQEKICERIYYFKKVQLLQLKVKIAKFIHR